MAEKLKELKQERQKVSFRGVDLYADGIYVPPHRLNHSTLENLQDTGADNDSSTEYHTNSDEFQSPVKGFNKGSIPAVLSPVHYYPREPKREGTRVDPHERYSHDEKRVLLRKYVEKMVRESITRAN